MEGFGDSFVAVAGAGDSAGVGAGRFAAVGEEGFGDAGAGTAGADDCVALDVVVVDTAVVNAAVACAGGIEAGVEGVEGVEGIDAAVEGAVFADVARVIFAVAPVAITV